MAISFHHALLLLRMLYCQIRAQRLAHKVLHFRSSSKVWEMGSTSVTGVSIQMMEYYVAILIIIFLGKCP